MENLHQTLHEEMKTAQLRQKENYDQHRKPDPNLKSGDMVWLILRNIKTTRPSKKFRIQENGTIQNYQKDGDEQL